MTDQPRNDAHEADRPFLEERSSAAWIDDLHVEIEGERRKQRRGWRVVFIVAVVVFIVSVAALGVIAFSYLQGQQKYSEIAENADFNASEASEDADVGALTVDWDALKKANSDTVAWVYIPKTVINYPVVQGEDNEFYLYHDFDGEAGWLAEYGAIFMDHANKPDWTDPVYFIFGHHMNDGSMFADISAMQDQKRFDASRTVYLLTPQGNFKLRSFSLVHCAADEEIVMNKFDKTSDMVAYVQDKIDRAAVDVGSIPKASEIDKVFAFATCDNYGGGRYILFTYVLDTSVDDLVGTVGVKKKKGETTGLVDDLGTKKKKKKA